MQLSARHDLNVALNGTTAGRFLPGSPALAAPSEASQTSPLRGSTEAIGQSRLPGSLLLGHIGTLGIGATGIPLRSPDRLGLARPRDITQQRCKRDAPIACLLGQQVARVLRVTRMVAASPAIVATA
jgi:hypothetical protein